MNLPSNTGKDIKKHDKNNITKKCELESIADSNIKAQRFFDNQLLSYKQASQYLSLSVPYLRRLKAKGEIPFVPFGRTIRFKVSSLNSWVQEREIR